MTDQSRLTRTALVWAPLLWLAGWVIMRWKGHLGPGAAWTAAHSVWVVAFALFAVVAVHLYRRLDGSVRVLGGVSAAMSLFGAVAMIGQMGIDLWSGFGAADKAAMGERADQAMSLPGVDLVLYQVAPALLYFGLLLQLVLLAARRKAGWAAPALVALGIVLVLVGRGVDGVRLLEGLGSVAIWGALAPLARRARHQV
ncbi:hypothetical protein QEZ54_17540 [Catellatospora sp. KI3]|uniref:hypothetical protein n=1 Tax=Catellatospora sp. KI3 TaxID=3041620 RepID=UPI002482D3C2|nr:hypothetical protein [Catellatospora sp. KI3]MDI1462782.1 hypothetical protein [Catellatospora sp. KI3]